jgi:Tfp pilus assembly protein PilV
MKKRFTSGFSLIEVTLAIGIAAFCLIAVFGLIPVAAVTNRNATSQTTATNLMGAVVADLRATPRTSNNSLQFAIPFPSSTPGPTPVTRYFNSQGQCACDSAGLQRPNPLTRSCSLTWSPALQLRYRVDITWSSAPTGSRYADVKVWWPAAATAANASGSTEMFAGFDRN